MQVEAWMANQPALDGWDLVRVVVVEDEMEIEFLRHVTVNDAQEVQKLASAVATMEATDDPAGLDIQSGKQRCRTVPNVIVRPSLTLANT